MKHDLEPYCPRHAQFSEPRPENNQPSGGAGEAGGASEISRLQAELVRMTERAQRYREEREAERDAKEEKGRRLNDMYAELVQARHSQRSWIETALEATSALEDISRGMSFCPNPDAFARMKLHRIKTEGLDG